MVESLSRKLIVEKEAGYLPGIKIARDVDPINHVFFLLGGSSMNISRAFHIILNKFCHISGALINKTKSVVYGWNVEFSVIL